MKVVPRAQRPAAASPPPSPPFEKKSVIHDIAAIGAVKTASQHVGNIGFGLASALAFGSQARNLFKHAAPSMKMA